MIQTRLGFVCEKCKKKYIGRFGEYMQRNVDGLRFEIPALCKKCKILLQAAINECIQGFINPDYQKELKKHKKEADYPEKNL